MATAGVDLHLRAESSGRPRSELDSDNGQASLCLARPHASEKFVLKQMNDVELVS
jgi:hypothetical protein